jgi:ketosteroid isomerase-like protein
MKRLLISMTILGLLIVPQFALGSDVDDLEAADQKLVQAWNSLDVETLASLISQGAVSYGPGDAFPIVAPMVSTHAERAESLKMYLENTEYIFMNPYNIQSRVFGNTGIVWGHVTVSGKAKGEPVQTSHLRYTSTWIKSDGKWLIVMNHYSAIPPGD